MTYVQTSIDVAAPVEQVYARWLDFERYPDFMVDVREVRFLGQGRLAWHTVVGGDERTWETIIVEQIPNQRIAWRSLGEPYLGGAVDLSATRDGRTRVTLSYDIEPQEFITQRQTSPGANPADLRASLERFQRHMEMTASASVSDVGSERAVGSTIAGIAAEDIRPIPGMSAPGALTTPPEPIPPGFTGAMGRGSAPPDGAGISQQGGGTGGMGAGGSFGGSREDDVGPGLSDGMRSAHGIEASGGVGQADDNQLGLPQGQTPPSAEAHESQSKRRRKRHKK